MAECRVLFLGHCDLDHDLRPSFKKNCVGSISLIFFKLGIPNLMCRCVFGWLSVAYHFWVTVTLNLTSDIVSNFALSLMHISYILLDSNSKFCV